MLKTKTLVSVLSQPIDQYPQQSTGELVSSILLTPSGQAIASYHSTRPPAYTASSNSDSNSDSKLVDGIDNSPSFRPYDIDRGMKTKIYCLFASTAWREYASNNDFDAVEGASKWISLKTSDALVFIQQVNERFLYTLIASKDTPLGLVTLKADQVVVLLRDSLGDFHL